VLTADDELVEEVGILTLKPFRNSKILLPYLLVGDGDSARSKQRANGRNGAHLVPLDDKRLFVAAEKNDIHKKYSDLVPIQEDDQEPPWA